MAPPRGRSPSRGPETWIGLTVETTSVRSYDALEPLRTMVRRTAFARLGRSYALTALAVAGMRLYGRRKREASLLPVAAALYAAMTVDSAIAHARGRGGPWRNRVYGAPPHEA